MTAKASVALLCIAGMSVMLSCGGSGPVPELSMVPGTALVHLHIEEGFNSRARSLAGEFFQGIQLADSLLLSGPLGVALVGVDITTMEPQLLILSDRVTPEYTSALAARQLDLDPRQEDNRIDLVSPQGYARAAVAERDGWTALYIGPAPHITIGSWLELDQDNSLAADSALGQVIPHDAQITVLFPGNLFGFLALLPLERQIPWWEHYKDTNAAIQPSALAVGISWPDPPEDFISITSNLARRQGGVVRGQLILEDSGVDADSVLALVGVLMEGMI